MNKQSRRHFIKDKLWKGFILTFFSFACVVESYLDRQHGVVIFAVLIPFLYILDKSLNTITCKTN